MRLVRGDESVEIIDENVATAFIEAGYTISPFPKTEEPKPEKVEARRARAKKTN